VILHRVYRCDLEGELNHREGVMFMVSFETFWERLKGQLAQLPGPKPGLHVRTIRKWSQFQDYFDGEFILVYHAGNVITCATATTNNVRTGIGAAEFRKVRGLAGLPCAQCRLELNRSRPGRAERLVDYPDPS